MKTSDLIEILIDGDLVDSKKELHKIIREKFGFPSYYGNNLDALNDFLSVINQETILTIYNFQNIRKTLGRYADKLLDVLEYTAGENQLFNYVIIEEGISLETNEKGRVL